MVVADPFSHWAVFQQNEYVLDFSRNLGLPHLPVHLHEILASFGFYIAIYFAVGAIFGAWTPYKKLNAELRSGFASHVVSEVNAILLLIISFPLFGDENLKTLVSYTPYCGFVAAVCSGYFMFDMFVTALWYKSNGLGFALHAVASFFVFIQGNRPFLHQYAAPYIWFEASTPFVNVHWLATNVPGVVSKTTELVNGVLLIVVFLLCRVIAGPINGYYLFSEALFTDLPGVPYWIVSVIFICYTVLSTLNIYWFGKMITVAYKVLSRKANKSAKNTEPEKVDTESIGNKKIPVDAGVRKRRI